MQSSAFAVELTQRDAWLEEIKLLHAILVPYGGLGSIYLEFDIPRLGKRVDAIVIINGVIFVLEFKVGERHFASHAIDQVFDYALDLKNFHEGSHHCFVVPILIATNAEAELPEFNAETNRDGVVPPLQCSSQTLQNAFTQVLDRVNDAGFDRDAWENSRYCPTPTIIEAATALYGGHAVEDISRKEAEANNLSTTSTAIFDIIAESKRVSQKSICFVTGVPGAGKTLVGLDVATQHLDPDSELYSVFLSGNGPLVAVLQEALAKDRVRRLGEQGQKVKIGKARSEVKAFIQNVHHFRDEGLADMARAPVEHVVLFDEAQRAWNLAQTSKFMKEKKKKADFGMSEPEFLISCMDRHPDWAVIVCLVGGGQEINTGEAGIMEWIESVERSFPDWHLYISNRLTDSEYGAGAALNRAKQLPHTVELSELHLSVSMRSFRAERVSLLIKQLLDLDAQAARETLRGLRDQYPILLTRDLARAKRWLRAQARGNERYGLVVSSHAYRLKPHAIDVRLQVDPVHWFLDGKEDVRSSYYLEDAATEYRVQGLELDWVCMTWDADFRQAAGNWQHWAFVGDRWNKVKKAERQSYLKNAYRVLLTRARQGMVIVVPEGDANDNTRKPEYYDQTFNYLSGIGFTSL